MMQFRFSKQNIDPMHVLLTIFGGFAACFAGYFTEFIVLPVLFAIASADFFRLFSALRFEPNFLFALFGSEL
jgi:hypothetical protein